MKNLAGLASGLEALKQKLEDEIAITSKAKADLLESIEKAKADQQKATEASIKFLTEVDASMVDRLKAISEVVRDEFDSRIEVLQQLLNGEEKSDAA